MQERERALWLLFLYFSLPLGLPYANWASQECCLFYLKSSLRSSDLPLLRQQQHEKQALDPNLGGEGAILPAFCKATGMA